LPIGYREHQTARNLGSNPRRTCNELEAGYSGASTGIGSKTVTAPYLENIIVPNL
jgi:hypothetical protein